MMFGIERILGAIAALVAAAAGIWWKATRHEKTNQEAREARDQLEAHRRMNDVETPADADDADRRLHDRARRRDL